MKVYTRQTYYFAADTENNVPKRGITEEELKKFKTRVWACGCCLLGNHKAAIFEKLSDMFDFICNMVPSSTRCIVYFHNLTYDASFILDEILKRGFQYTGKKPNKNQFTTIISSEGSMYSLRVKWEWIDLNGKQRRRTIEFRDSLKILPMKLEQLGKNFETEHQKLPERHDFYEEQREEGHVLTDEERKYLENDILVLSEALLKVQSWGLLDSLTIGSACMKDYKNIVGKNFFETFFPQLDVELDDKIRQSYKGGWCYVNPDIQGLDLHGQYFVYDVNSLYPYCMNNGDFIYPVGLPLRHAETEEEFDKIIEDGNPYFIKFKASLELLPGKLPFIKDSNCLFDNRYFSECEEREFTMTKIDYEMMLEHYDISFFEFVEAWEFEGKSGEFLFGEYIQKWNHLKVTAGKNKAQRQIAKLMNNNLYGKLSTNRNTSVRIPFLGDDDIVTYTTETETIEPVYIPAGSYITAYARSVTLKAAQTAYDMGVFCYSDTDSIHVRGSMRGILDIDDVRLGAWKEESHGDRCKFVKAKTYIEHEEVEEGKFELNIKACGCPDEVKKRIQYKLELNEDFEYDKNDNIITEKRTTDEIFQRFAVGLVESGKLMKKTVNGGIILASTYFSIR